MRPISQTNPCTLRWVGSLYEAIGWQAYPDLDLGSLWRGEAFRPDGWEVGWHLWILK